MKAQAKPLQDLPGQAVFGFAVPPRSRRLGLRAWLATLGGGRRVVVAAETPGRARLVAFGHFVAEGLDIPSWPEIGLRRAPDYDEWAALNTGPKALEIEQNAFKST